MMAPMRAGKRGKAPQGARGGRGRGKLLGPRRAGFKSARVEEDRDSDDDTEVLSEDEVNGTADAEMESGDTSSSENEELTTQKSYSALLQALRTNQPTKSLARKKRKLSYQDLDFEKSAKSQVAEMESETDASIGETLMENDVAKEEEDVSEVEDLVADEDSDDGIDNDTRIDPFEKHFATVDEQRLSSRIADIAKKRYQSSTSTLGEVSKTISSTSLDEDALLPVTSPEDVSFTKRLLGQASNTLKDFNVLEKDLTVPVFQYRDVLFASRNLRNAMRLRNLVSMHTLNHVFKTRDHVIKNNARLGQHDGEALDVRDQGFTRPKVLILLPTKQSCVKYVDNILSFCEPEQQENKARFLASFVREDDTTWEDKPEDFRELFSGNDDDMFRIGLKFTRKTIKYFCVFYNSDIILASPLGLRTAIETGGSGKDKKKGYDADFLSSIELVVVDQTNALLMQNWEHVEYIFSQLNLLPKESHGCDFSRVRTWYLDNRAQYLRQTIILSDFLTPEINGLVSNHMRNVAGRLKYVPTYKGTVHDLPAALPANITQTFSRFESPSPPTDSDSRFKYFTSTVLPPLLHEKHLYGTLIFTPTYLDLTMLRNHFSTSAEAASLSFGAISEYTSVRDVARARSHFLNGRHSILLYTERAHHFRRYRIRGVKRVIFYGVPANPLFWNEIVAFLGLNPGDSNVGSVNTEAVRALFSKWDVLKMNRIVGTMTMRGRLMCVPTGESVTFRWA